MMSDSAVEPLTLSRQSREPIAIVGIGCRFPGGAHDPRSFWQMLRSGVDAIVEVPADRWNTRTFYHADARVPGRATTRWGGFVHQRIDEFDARFFGMSPREAAYLDPMQRWVLEVAWEALEDGGQVPERLAGGSVGVFIGGFTEDIKLLQMSESNRDLVDTHTATGNAMTMLSARISYVFDFRGPSLALDTACSSSLVATHLACQSIWSGESSIALAGGVNTMFKPDYTVAESKAGMLSPDGRSRAFDSRANGYVRGEGAGIVVLKPVSAALADGDAIYALIRGTAVNQDGRTPGITVPSGAAQQALLQEACRQAGVEPGQLQYVEAHGTGTPVGDPIEANALAAALAIGRPTGDKCVIGSVKTNIGHLEAAAGIAGLIKTALCLAHRVIPPHLHLQQPNTAIPLDSLAVRIPRELEPWPMSRGPALAGVNSFGFGGTNAHVILQEAPVSGPPSDEPRSAEPGQAELVTLSARGDGALRAVASAQREFVRNTEPAPLHDIAYTAALRRAQHDHRLAIVARSGRELHENLDAWLAGEERAGVSAARLAPGARPRLAFVFTGMGPQWYAMGRQLLEEEPIFRTAIERVHELLRPYASWSLIDEWRADERSSRMAETQIAQPANFALQVALAELWRAWGVEPDATVGHSAGEVAAAWAAGALSLEEATRVIFHRARLQHQTTGLGKLVAVGLSLDEARERLRGFEGRISIAAVNSPTATTLVGDPEALDEIVRPLQERQVFCRYLKVDVPYHSHYMDPLQSELLSVLRDLRTGSTRLPLFSTVTGAAAAGPDLDAHYWWRNVREPVYFAAAAECLIEAGYDAFLEIGPHPVLSTSLRECLALRGREATVLHSLRRGDDERATVLGALGTLYTLGQPVDFEALYGRDGRLLRMPTYPWQRERHWAESKASLHDRLGEPGHPLLGRRLASAQPTWEVKVDRRVTPFLEDHRIQSAVVYPGAAYVEMMVAAARGVAGAQAPVLEFSDVEFRKALFLAEGEVSTLQVSVNQRDLAIEVHSPPAEPDQPWTLHARGTLERAGQRAVQRVDLGEVRARCNTQLTSDECYTRFEQLGFRYGPAFQGIDELWLGTAEAVARTRADESVTADLETYYIHPSLLDACFQVLLMAVVGANAGERSGAFMPVGAARFWVYGRPAPGMWIHTRLTEQNASGLTGDIRLIAEDGQVVLAIEGLRAQSLEQASHTGGETLRDLLYELRWVEDAEPPVRDEREPGRWLVLGTVDGTLERSLVERLEQRGDTCVLVAPGSHYAVADDVRQYVVDPMCPEHFQRLFADAFGSDQQRSACRGIVHLWGLDPASSTSELSVNGLEQTQRLTCLAVMHLVQALDRAGWRELPRLWLATRGSQRVGDEQTQVAVAQGALWGLARTLAHQEHMELWGGIVDLDPRAPVDEAAMLLDTMLDARGTDQVAFRDGARFVPRLERRRDLAQSSLPARLRPDGSYLITGGLGGLGLQVAGWMVERGARRLILLGRSPLPPRTAWKMVESEGGPLAERIAAVRKLEAMGASVQVVALDVADEPALVAFLERHVRDGWPAIRGVVHLAGVAQPQLLLNMDAATFETALRPKVLGAWLLHEHLRDEPLDFFVLFSSIAALGFSMGQANYAAGNAFLDALAQHRHASGRPALSINWGAWAEVGMASQLDLVHYFNHRGLPPMPPRQGIEALAALFTAGLPQATVVAADWPVVDRNNYPLGRAPAMLADLVAEQHAGQAGLNGVAHEHRSIDRQMLLEVDATERAPLLEEHLLEVAARVLRLGQSTLDPTQALNTLGLDSMMAIELKNRVEAGLSVSISVVELLQGCSVHQLVERVLDQIEVDHSEADTEVEDLLAAAEELSDEELRAVLEGSVAVR